MLPLLSTINRVIQRLPATVKSFAHALRAAGPLAARSDAGLHIVPTDQIVGSLSRAQELRPDFTFKRGPALTARHRRIARAMRAGQPLPPLELYALTVRGAGPERLERREYYVVDGHHRVAMARRLGQDFVDAHVVEYRVAEARAGAHPGGLPQT